MSRLIDAELLLSRISDRYDAKKNIVPDSLAEGFVQMEKLIKEQPTAFDVEKVVEQLNELLEEKTSDSGEDWYTAECLERAIGIVKRGGRDGK